MWHGLPLNKAEGSRKQLLVITLQPGTTLSDYVFDVVRDKIATCHTCTVTAVLMEDGQNNNRVDCSCTATFQLYSR